MQAQNPRRVVQSVQIGFHGGAVFNNGQIVIGDSDGPPFGRIELLKDDAFGHSFALRLPRASPVTHPTPGRA